MKITIYDLSSDGLSWFAIIGDGWNRRRVGFQPSIAGLVQAIHWIATTEGPSSSNA